MKGIILAGGSGSRLYPLTSVTSKQLLPIYDKPMIYYALSTLMLAGIKDILLISTPLDVPRFEQLLGNGSQFGIRIQYAIQEEPNGLAESFIIGEDFIDQEPCAMILGDNFFYGGWFRQLLNHAASNILEDKATIFGYYVADPSRFGVVEFDNDMTVLSIQEKPKEPRSNYCVTGLYFYPGDVSKKARTLKPSSRNELEITDLNNLYCQENRLKLQLLGRGFAWTDMGTIDSLMDTASFVQTVQQRQGVVISAPEEIAYHEGWICKSSLIKSASKYGNSPYGEHLRMVAEDRIYFGV